MPNGIEGRVERTERRLIDRVGGGKPALSGDVLGEADAQFVKLSDSFFQRAIGTNL
jgi:hypothetical protein